MLPDSSRHGRALTPIEEDALLDACKGSGSRSLYPAVSLALCTGLRLKELRFLTWDRINLQTMHLVVGESKTFQGSNRGIPLNKRAQDAISEWASQFPNRQSSHYVFLTERGCAFNREGKRCFHHQDPTKPIGSWSTAWRTARKKSGVSARFHDIRHTVTTRMLENGVPRGVISALLGWSASTEVLMMKRYGHIGNEAFRKAVDILQPVWMQATERENAHL
jgi:integrase